MGIHKGDSWEKTIEKVNEYYKNNNIALIQKIATPMSIVRKNGIIVSAYYQKKSTVDFIGVAEGKAICFDAKEFKEERGFPLKNIAEHQYQYMKLFEENGGKSYLLINSISNKKVYIMEFKLMQYYFLLHEKNKGKRGFAHVPMEILNDCCHSFESGEEKSYVQFLN